MSNKDKEIIDKYFNPNLGFGIHKSTALELLKICIDMLNEFNINYFLISGTLLGQVRHNDFIPWDDDIDIIVDNTIITKLPEITAKYDTLVNFLNKGTLLKICFDNKVNKLDCILNKFLLKPNKNYCWPFIDLFVYTDYEYDNKMNFFQKSWNKDYFFPPQKVKFNNILVNIPKDPHYFLKINYKSADYMTTLVSNNYQHKTEKNIRDIKTISIYSYNSNKLDSNKIDLNKIELVNNKDNSQVNNSQVNNNSKLLVNIIKNRK